MAVRKPEGAEKEKGLDELDQLVRRSETQWARIEELLDLQESRDIMIPGLPAAVKQYTDLLVRIREMRLSIPWDDGTGVTKQASGRQGRIRGKRTATPKAALFTLGRPDPSEAVKKPKPAITIHARKLPRYAAHARRERLVQILCKANCAYTYIRRGAHLTWAEMNADYPGQEVLWRTQVGDFRARCLRCGATALDCYNWLQ